MEVTRENFKTVLAQLDNVLNSASFLAIDCEFTGLQKGNPISSMDTARERYERLHSGAVDFLVVQFGLVAFQYVEESNRYQYRAYNFYIFPQTVSCSGAPDPKFLSQASSLVFLASQGFDFNKLFKLGIPYMTLAEEEAMRVTLEERQLYRESMQTPNGNSGSLAIPEEQKSFMESIFMKVQIYLDGTDDVLTLENCTPFQRKLIYIHVRSKYPSVQVYSKEIDRQRVMFIKRVDEEERERIRRERKQEEHDAVDDAIGFSRVLHKITKSGKVVVGHNMLLDVCHIIHQFYARLPESYDEFKSLTNTVFPKLVDTKVMASTQPFKNFIPNSALRDLLKTLQETPFRAPLAETFADFPGYDIDKDLSHEAGYDAYMTGLCFIAMSDYLGCLASNTGKQVILPDSPLIEPFLNKVFMMRVFDIPYMNLGGPDIEPNRDHVFVVTFPKEWKTADVIQLFSVYGPVFVSWIDSTSAYVSLQRKENSVLILRELVTPSCCTITSYALYKSTAAAKKQTTAAAAAFPQVTPKRGAASTAAQQPETKKQRLDQETFVAKGNGPQAQFEVPDAWD